MSKTFLYCLLFALLVFASACNKNTTQRIVPNKSNEQTSEEPVSAENIPSPGNDDISLIYKNMKLGYQLEFPNDWKGWYLIDEFDNGLIRIKFYGKSKTGTIAAKEYFGDGLPMFYILPENVLEQNKLLDSIKKIGSVNGVNFFFATGTGFDLGLLYSISISDSFAIDNANYEVDEKELKLAAEDWSKAQQMYSQIDSVLETFRKIEVNP